MTQIVSQIILEAELGEDTWVTYDHPLIKPFDHISMPEACSRNLPRAAAWIYGCWKCKFFSLIFLHFADSLTNRLQQYLSLSWGHRQRRAHLAGFGWRDLFFSVINSSHLVNSNSKAVVQKKIPRLPESTPDWMWLAWTTAAGPPSSELSQIRAWVTWLRYFWTTKCIREL